MLRKYHGIVGALAATLASDSPVMQVSANLAAAFAQTFENGVDTSFLAIRSASAYEIVRVTDASGTLLTVDRAQEGTAAYAFPAGAAVEYVVTSAGVMQEFLDNGGGAQTAVNASGILEAQYPEPGVVDLRVEPPTFEGLRGIEVMGAWPSLQIAYSGAGDCCGTGSDTGYGYSDGVRYVEPYGILDAYIDGDTLYAGIAEPQFGGNGITISGTWPYLYFSLENGAGSGTVTSVNVGAGLLLTGSPNSNPTISISNTGVAEGTYGDVQVNTRGQFTYIKPGFNPISSIVSDNGTVSLVRSGGTVTMDVADADIGVPGVVALADHTDDFDPADATNAATPAVIAKAMSQLVMPTLAGAKSYIGESDSEYTNTISGSATAVSLAAGERAVVYAETTAIDFTNPGTVIEYGIGVFDNGPSRVQANKRIAQNQQTMSFVVEGPIEKTYAISTTGLSGSATITSWSLWVAKF